MKEKLGLAGNEVKQVIKGKDEIVDKVLAAMIAGGHILLEDIPGVGKTTLAVAVAKAMSLVYRRVQFTPDVLPSDIVGFSMYNKKTDEFEYKPGAVMCNLFLADEINRTSPKTQSALLEVMEERKVTVDGVTRKLATPFTVIATENPLGSSGTQKLPESLSLVFFMGLSDCTVMKKLRIRIQPADTVVQPLSDFFVVSQAQLFLYRFLFFRLSSYFFLYFRHIVSDIIHIRVDFFKPLPVPAQVFQTLQV